MTVQQNLHDLAVSIKAGIARHGVHILDAGELSPVMGHVDPDAEFEKRLCIENFGRSYGFDVHWSTFLQVAIFRKPEGDGPAPSPR